MKVLVLGVGGPAGANTCRALVAAGHRVIGYEGNPLHRSFGWDWCHELLPDTFALTVDEINEVGADVVLAQPDPLARWLADHQDDIDADTLVSDVNVVDACQDKMVACRTWCEQGLRSLPPCALSMPEPGVLPDMIGLAVDTLGLPMWVRATRGAGAQGSALIQSKAQAYHWLRFWAEQNTDMEFVAEEFLPGRDYSWCGVYHRGGLVSSFARERVEYIYPHLSVSGRTGTPTVATVVHDSLVNEMAEAAVHAMAWEPHGIMCVDLREDELGVPRPTEINAGRFCTTIGAWHLAGVNYPDLVVRLAADGPRWWLRRPDLTEPPVRDAIPAGTTLARHIDLPARVVNRTQASMPVRA